MNELHCKKIAVIGCCGSGKSYFSKELAELLNLPCYHMDMLFWKPNWEKTPMEEFKAIVNNIIERNKWIIDGNYARTMEARFEKAETVYFLDMPMEVCLESEKRRRGSKRSDLPDYLEEYEDPELIEYIKNFNRDSKSKILALICKFPQRNTVTFSSREEVNNYLANLRSSIEKQSK